MTKTIQRQERKDYLEGEIEAGLTALALCSGHRDKAAELVESQGFKIPAETIRSWATRTHVDRYARIREQVAPRIQAELAEIHTQLADGAAQLEAATINRLDERLQQGDVEDKDLANILKNVAIAGGIHVEKAQLLKNLPTQIVQRDSTEILRELKAMGADNVVDAVVVDETSDRSSESVVAGTAIPAESQDSPA